MFTKRQKAILSFLVQNKDPIPAEWMARQLGVSDRTVRDELKGLRLQSHALGVKIESIRGKGYKLEIQDVERFQKMGLLLIKNLHVENQTYLLEQNDRVIYILKKFLLEKRPIKLESLEEELFVSKPTIQSDLKIVREILQKYKLKLTVRPRHGMVVEGEEYMKRLCLSNYILHRHHGHNGGTKIAFFENEDVFDRNLLTDIKEIIIKKVNEYNIEISDIALENLTIHIAIACKRIQEGFIIGDIQHNMNRKYPLEYLVATEIIKEVEHLTGLTFPQAEINYVIVHLLGTKLIQQETLEEFSEYDEVKSIVQCMLEQLREKLGWDFSDDTELIQGLTLHIRPAMNRLRYKMNIRNPLLDEVKTKYTSAFEGAVIASKCISDYLDMEVGEHEIAYIALHIGVALEKRKNNEKKKLRVIIVCASGVGSAKLLFYRLQRLFNDEIEIVSSTNYYQLRDWDLSSIDLIISTIPIQENIAVPVLVVSPLLNEQDIGEIRRRLLDMKARDKENYLDESRVFIHKDFEDKESVIRFICQELYKQGLVSEYYVNSVLERESLAPTNFGNLVAIPHPLVPETEETFWAMCTLKRPIEWHGEQKVQVVCLLNIKKGPTGNLEKMYQKLLDILEDKTIVRKIVKSQSPKEIIEIINSMKR